MKKALPRILATLLCIGALLRLIYAGDMEYKTDEHYMFERLMRVGVSEAWPWLGIPSGVYIKNPGMSVWIFLALGKLLGAQDAIGLVRGVELLNISALALLIFFIFRFVEQKEREPWIWGFAIACVNPFLILYHRKIWAQSVLPFFCILFLMSWWRRNTKRGAFFWGLIGACLGQIHMSGFFFALAFVIWAAVFETSKTAWRAWFTGSVIGSFTLIPWIIDVFTHRTGQPVGMGWGEAIQLKFWVFWITDPTGLHLGNTLGVKNGNSSLVQLGDFLRYPLFGGKATYLMALAHAMLLSISSVILVRGFFRILLKFRNWSELFGAKNSESTQAQNVALWIYGLLLTASTILVRRYYLLITFPLEYVWFARLALLDHPKIGRKLLTGLVVVQLFVSGIFLWYIHVNHGAENGDYGKSFNSQAN